MRQQEARLPQARRARRGPPGVSPLRSWSPASTARRWTCCSSGRSGRRSAPDCRTAERRQPRANAGPCDDPASRPLAIPSECAVLCARAPVFGDLRIRQALLDREPCPALADARLTTDIGVPVSPSPLTTSDCHCTIESTANRRRSSPPTDGEARLVSPCGRPSRRPAPARLESVCPGRNSDYIGGAHG